ncbi:vWA domain-containing protein [Methylobacterium durans]|uniref:vWA domain-containing protein n=1 Tax=Methylobacterium durans TaxID=2202825 RepID=UPI002AFF4DE5|nr:vWA domain-containing protein [Methylobacterium durans]MEA1834405.1 vWA domain-containing protein [Methylobacterium durans]
MRLGLPWRRNLGGRRFQALAAAGLLALATFLVPPLRLSRDGMRLLAVVDITGSMNVRDYAAEGRPESRLEAAKAALRRLVAGLPCGSQVALGLFTERRPFLLFEPVEVCADFAPLDGAIAGLDWRMAWEADSRVAAGLYRAVAMAGDLDADLVFVTDGQEAPPLPSSGTPPFDGRVGAVRGLIVGAGGYALSPIPKFNDRGREAGFYAETDVQQENRFGPPPADAEFREGYNPRNAPFGNAAARGTEHLSSVREGHLKDLADRTGLAYAHLDGPASLAGPLVAAATPRPVPGRLDLRPFLGAAALILVLAAFAAGPLRARHGRLTLRKA